MKQSFIKSKLALLGLSLILSSAEVVSAQNLDDATRTNKKTREWVKQRSWANGLNAMPDKSVNCIEFASQYSKNKEIWDKVFHWLATHDLMHIATGRYEIDGERAYINVQEALTQDCIKRKIEAHKHTIDLQFVVKGTERFGIVPVKLAEPISEYIPDVTFYKTEKIKYVDSKKDRFFIFFPGDCHQALVKAGKEPENIRVIVAKIEYLD